MPCCGQMGSSTCRRLLSRLPESDMTAGLAPKWRQVARVSVDSSVGVLLAGIFCPLAIGFMGSISMVDFILCLFWV